ncbi:MAG: cobyrinate a,c-diamide synthase [Pseudomonadota bacterium]
MARLAPLRPLVAFLVAAPASGAGKTVTTTGLIAALRRRGLPVHPAKVGPDYIDTAFLSAAAGRPAVNLDVWAMRPALIEYLASPRHLVVEGVMGLFDGPEHGEGSSADVARRLGLPVVLVVSAERMSHSIAALVHGFATFDPRVEIAGVVLTRVGSARHERMLRQALAGTSVPVLGAIPRHEALSLPSRHLGLRQAREHGDLCERINAIADVVAEHVDLSALEALDAPRQSALPPEPLAPLGTHIAVAQDDAFAFTYAHILDGWQRAGATLTPFSPLAGEAPHPDADAAYLPGGYPELHAVRLRGERAWAEGLSRLADSGGQIYGECGGYMALGKVLVDGEGTAHAMAGLLPVQTSFAEPRRTLGYRRLQHDGSALPFAPKLRGHEFHYASQISEAGGEEGALFGVAGTGDTAFSPMGHCKGTVAGSFQHIIDAQS